MKQRIILCLLLCFSLKAFAQIPIVRNFTNMEYAGGTQNWDIDQATDDRMFFANNSGLMEFDGDKWYSFAIANYTNVRSILFDSQKEIVYAAGTDEFGYFYTNLETYKIEYKSLSANLPASERTFGEVWHIHNMGSGIVFEAKRRLFFQTAQGKLKVFGIPYRVETSAVIDNKVIVSCQEGNYIFDGSKLTALPGTDELKGKMVRAILPYYGKTLFVTAQGMMFLYDGKKLTPYSLDISPLLEASQVFCACVSDNMLAFGTVKNGLIVKNHKTGKNWYVNGLTGLQNNTVLSIKFDRNKNIWLGLDNGVSYVMVETPFADLLGGNNNIGTGYASVVMNGKLFLGTNQGLFFMPSTLSNLPGQGRPLPINGVVGQIWNLTNINNLLLCGADAGAFVVKGNQAFPVKGTLGTWGFKALKHHPGYILSSDYQGFVVLKQTGTGVELLNRVNGFSEAGAGFEEDSDGSIWLSHWRKGIYHIWLSPDLKSVACVELFNGNNGLPADDNNLITKIRGRVYVSSRDGFRHYNPKTRRLEKDERLTKVFSTYGQALRIAEMPDGKLWVYKDNYLSIAKPSGKGYKVDSLAFGNLIKRLQMSLGHIGILDTEHTLLNYDNGFYVMRNSYKGLPEHKHFFLRSIWSISGERDSLLYSHFPSQKVERVKIPHSLNSVRIEFVMPEYRDNKAVEYSCMLEGYEKSWSVPQTATYKEYTQLSRGTYTFRVKARNLVTGETAEVSITIEVLPAWYETWFAVFVYFCFFVGALYLLVKFLQKRAERKLVRMQEEKERQLKEQQTQFLIQEEKKEKELVKLRNDQLTIELKHKSGQLADSTMNLVRKNDMLQAIDEKMSELSDSVRKEEAKTYLTKKINDIRREIKSNMADDDNWEKFQENFNLVYDNFMQKLTAQFPDLKKNDLKLCAYLKMGLSSKEMASLLNTSVRSIETARYRLRKKLELDSGENLTNFIQNMEKEM
ncbi:triple tyrosine motif-containing protein [Prevotella sp. HUN102]|uniref:triple tyrosine motif-containing protein n=1 Tax=Prevotella sp. HUN102 TaxID=1392486 RepID=UPI00049208A8|nr:triple tyrosine motif-containing protein [Prevotella sp. HUN102]